jgi:hypothetical protein
MERLSEGTLQTMVVAIEVEHHLEEGVSLAVRCKLLSRLVILTAVKEYLLAGFACLCTSFCALVYAPASTHE